MRKVIVIGGGLAGLISATRIARAGISCLLLEKRAYPFHRVCGEYISNETRSFLLREKLFPYHLQPCEINQLQLSSVNGQSKKLDLNPGGFGLSRFAFDHFLSQEAIKAGVEIIQQEVTQLSFDNKTDLHEVKTDQQKFNCYQVIGSFGKRSKLDYFLDRSFLQHRSPYVGVKYHIRTNHPANLIALHNFNGGYCGISNIEEGKTNLCYLVHRDLVKHHKTIPDLEKNVLLKNPHLIQIFQDSEFLFNKPEIINEISFMQKEPVLEHILMAGDSAGMIAPLCGNGMAMAIHSGMLVSDIIIQAEQQNLGRNWIEQSYSKQWKQLFSKRLRIGRIIQNNLFGSEWSSRIAITLAIYSKSISELIIKNTHGKSF